MQSFKPLYIAYLCLIISLTGYANTPIWQIGTQDESSSEFADYTTVTSIAASSITAGVFPKGMQRSIDPDIEITFDLPSVPVNGVMFTFKLLDADRVGPEMAIFSNDVMAGLIQLWGTQNTVPAPPYAWKKTYQLYIPQELLQAGSNTLRLEAPRPLYCGSGIDPYLVWEWDYLKLESLSNYPLEPIHGKMTHIGNNMRKGTGFSIDQEVVDLTPIAIKWLGIAHSNNPMRAGFWSDISTSKQSHRLELLQAFRELNMTVIADHLNTNRANANLVGDELGSGDKTRLDNFFNNFGNYFQWYEVDNELGLFNRTKEVNIAIANYVNQIKPDHIKTTAPGWAFDAWARSPQQRLEVERLTQALNGHSYGNSYAKAQGGSFVENLETYQGVSDGWPKEYINTEMGTNDGHTDWSFTDSSQPHASAFDRIMRAHVAVVDRFLQHATTFGSFGIFDAPDWSNPTSLTAKAGVNGEDNRLKAYRRAALAYATHGKPLPYEYLNKTAIAGKKVYFRAVDASTLPPMKGNGHTTDKILLSLVNFESTTQTVEVRVTLPNSGSFTAERIGSGDSYTTAYSTVNLSSAPDLIITETLGAGESVQYILPGGQGQAGNYPPEASFTASSISGDTPLTVNFDASASYDPNGNPLTYTWDFGDGSTGSGVSTSHTYTGSTAQTLVAKLTVSDGQGGSDAKELNITLNTGVPDLVITDVGWDPGLPADGDLMRFNATVKNNGSAPTPAGTVIGVNFEVDGVRVAWSDKSTEVLAPGESRVLVANDDPLDNSGQWVFDPGKNQIIAEVDDTNLIDERDEDNNALAEPLTNDGGGGPGLPDLVITDIGWEPNNPVNGDEVRFNITVQNNGAAATPDGITIGGAFKVDGKTIAWTDNSSDALPAGATRTLEANGGPGGSTGLWIFDDTKTTVSVKIDDINRIVEEDETNNSASELLRDTIVVDSQTPYVTHRIPGIIQAEDYDEGGADVAYVDTDTGNNGGVYRNDDVDIAVTTDAGGGYIVGWTRDGEWLEYTLANVTAGAYDIRFRVASNNSITNKTLTAELNGNPIGSVSFGSTGGWQTWETVTLSEVNIPGGSDQVLRLSIGGGYFNLNYVEFVLPVTNTIETLSPVADSYIYDKTPNTNYGNDTEMVIKSSSTINFNRKSLLKFDLSTFSNIDSAILELECWSKGSITSNITAYQLEDTWTETGVSWNNAPAAGAAITTTSVANTGIVRWDLSSYANTQTGQEMSVLLESNQTVDLLKFYGKESSTGAVPVLKVYGTQAAYTSIQATEIVSFRQGMQRNGRQVSTDRSDPAMALGTPQENDDFNFVSLGFGGSITLKLNRSIANGPGPDLRVVETSFNDANRPCEAYPELADVAVSADGVDYITMAEARCKEIKIDLAGSGLDEVQYVRITDVSNPNNNAKFGGTADGYDVDGVMQILPAAPNSRQAAFTVLPNRVPDEVSDDLLDLSMYPNPVSDALNIRLSEGGKESSVVQVTILDLAGRWVSSDELSLENQCATYQLSHLKPGLYLIKCQTSEQTVTERLIVQ